MKDLKPKEQTKAVEDKSDKKLSIQKENYDRLLDERVDEIPKIRGQINYNKLIYYFTTPDIAPINFIKFKGPFNTFKEIRDGDKTLQEIKEDQKKLKSSLGELTSGNPKHKREYQLDTTKNVQSLYDSNLTQVKAGNNSESLLDKMRQIVYSLYQSKEIINKIQ